MDKPAHLHTLSFKLSASPSADPGQAPDAPLAFSGIAYSGGVVPAYGWMGDVAIDLATLQNPPGDELPVLADHDTRINAIAGKGRISVHTSANGILSLHIAGTITRATEAGQRIAALLAEGYPIQMSVGMAANFRETSQPMQINGQTMTVAGVFEQPHVREVSFVSVGADPATRAGAAERPAEAFAFAASFHPPITRPKEPTTMTRTPEDQALIDSLQTQVAELSAQMEAQRLARRTADLAALMTEVGRDAPTADAAKPYLSMSDDAFATFSADLRAVAKASHPAADRTLFGSQSITKATQGKPQGQGAAGGTADAGQLLMASVARLSGQPTRTTRNT